MASTLKEPQYIESPAALKQWAERLEHADAIAVDTESDSFHHYREKVCLMQMTALGEDVIIDPLAMPDMEPLRAILERPKPTKIFHDAGYDLVCLRRDFRFDVQGLFDTMVASRLLGIQNFGLASLLQDRFGFEANKRLQRSDWARRPLTEEQISYARFDTHFLPRLAELLENELRQAGRWDWAVEDFARLPETAAKNGQRNGDPDTQAFWRVRGVKAMSPGARGRVRALYELRDKLARRLDRPPFKVFSDSVIVDIAEHPPKKAEELPRPGLRRGGAGRFGDEVMRALARAKPISGRPPPGTGRRRRAGRFLDPDARKRYEALRGCRKREAEKLGIDPEVAIANATLESLAKNPPSSVSGLVTQGRLNGWRKSIFVEPLLAVLKPPIRS